MGLELLLSPCWYVVLGEACAWEPALRSITPFLTKLLVLSILQSRNGSLIAGCLNPVSKLVLAVPDLTLVQIFGVFPPALSFGFLTCAMGSLV